ncbi:sodium channel protein Nach-like [Tigriopus californicus]|uniref:sodium channel protein Nach-like n=1 Tax=Tigriopus californicus TaxID=6832 RepID=UPI0027DA3521|nr:sodium channel protein Nach-like [Tigriopus californicus]
MCCTFNMEKAEVMFQKNRYSRMVTRMQEDDFIGSFGGPELPSWYTNNNEPKSKSGKFKGLTLVLDAHTDVVSAGTVSEDFQGFLGLVEENSQFPLVKERSFLIQPGHVTYAAISATGIIASDAIQSVSPVTRNCYFPNEFELQVHSNYSRANCLLECSMDYARNKLEEKCIPWYFPTTDEQAKPCDPWLTKQFLNIMEQIHDETCSYCLPDCEGTVINDYHQRPISEM